MILLLNFGLPKSRTRVISRNLGLSSLLQQTLRRWSNIWYFCLCRSGIPRLDQRQSLLRCQPEIHKDSEPIYSIIIRTQVADADSRVCTSLWKCLANSSSPHVLVSLGKFCNKYVVNSKVLHSRTSIKTAPTKTVWVKLCSASISIKVLPKNAVGLQR